MHLLIHELARSSGDREALLGAQERWVEWMPTKVGAEHESFTPALGERTDLQEIAEVGDKFE